MMEQDPKGPVQYESTCFEYCELSGQAIVEEEAQDDDPVCASCLCKLYIYVVMGMSALFILWKLVRRLRVGEGYMIDWLGIALRFIVFALAFRASAERGETAHAMWWWCLTMVLWALMNFIDVMEELLYPWHFRRRG